MFMYRAIEDEMKAKEKAQKEVGSCSVLLQSMDYVHGGVPQLPVHCGKVFGWRW